MSHPFDGVPTFALTDHTQEFVSRQTSFIIKKLSKIPLIIICKGIQKNHRFEKCVFLHDGDWGDSELIEHQKYHESNKDKNYSWLGFDAPQDIGKFSGRDGKRT